MELCVLSMRYKRIKSPEAPTCKATLESGAIEEIHPVSTSLWCKGVWYVTDKHTFYVCNSVSHSLTKQHFSATRIILDSYLNS